MAEFKHKLNTGSLFKNNKKQIATDPDLIGKCNDEGVEKTVLAWYPESGIPELKFVLNKIEISANDNKEQPPVANDNVAEKPKIFVQKPQ